MVEKGYEFFANRHLITVSPANVLSLTPAPTPTSASTLPLTPTPSTQVVDKGYEFFANRHLITVFSATDYCGQHKNDGALLEIDRDLVITPKLVKCKTSQWSVARDSSPPRGRGGAGGGGGGARR